MGLYSLLGRPETQSHGQRIAGLLAGKLQLCEGWDILPGWVFDRGCQPGHVQCPNIEGTSLKCMSSKLASFGVPGLKGFVDRGEAGTDRGSILIEQCGEKGAVVSSQIIQCLEFFLIEKTLHGDHRCWSFLVFGDEPLGTLG